MTGIRLVRYVHGVYPGWVGREAYSPVYTPWWVGWHIALYIPGYTHPRYTPRYTPPYVHPHGIPDHATPVVYPTMLHPWYTRVCNTSHTLGIPGYVTLLTPWVYHLRRDTTRRVLSPFFGRLKHNEARLIPVLCVKDGHNEACLISILWEIWA